MQIGVGWSLPQRRRDYQVSPNWDRFRGSRSSTCTTSGRMAIAGSHGLLDTDFAVLSPNSIALYLFQRVHFPRHHTYLHSQTAPNSPPDRAVTDGYLGTTWLAKPLRLLRRAFVSERVICGFDALGFSLNTLDTIVK